MNRRERRAQGGRGGALHVPFYGLKGKGEPPVEAMYFDHGDEPYGQVRLVDVKVMREQGLDFDSVAAAEAAGRGDLVRCFMLGRRGPGPEAELAYLEQPGGHDRVPHMPVEMAHSLKLAPWLHLQPLVDDILSAFADGGVWPFQAWALAISRSSQQAGRSPEGCGEELARFMRESGYAELHGGLAGMAASLQQLPEVGRRYTEHCKRRGADA